MISKDSELQVLMAAHTAIVAVSVAAILYALFRGFTGVDLARDPWVAAALAWPALIQAQRLVNGVECVLQTRARKLRGMTEGWARDVLWLPESWARKIPAVCAPPYYVAFGLVVGRVLEQAIR